MHPQIPRRAANWLLALVAALVLSAASLLDGPDPASTEADIAADLQAALATAKEVRP